MQELNHDPCNIQLHTDLKQGAPQETMHSVKANATVESTIP